MWASILTFITLRVKGVVTKHHQQYGKVFNFRREMVDYCLQDVRILLSAMQVAVREDLSLMDFDGMAECCTIASKTMMFFAHGFLKDKTIGVIRQTGVTGHRNQSREGLLWLLLQEVNYPHSRHREKKFCSKVPRMDFTK